jgi:D-alanine-D-alanine ligase
MSLTSSAPRIDDPRAFGKVAVLCGGWSAEREVSLQSGSNVYGALRRGGVTVELLDVDRGAVLALGARGFDRVVNLLHGTGGEDGTVQAVLDLLGLPYPGTGVLGSALAMDKLRCKRLWRAEGLPTADFAELPDLAAARAAADQLGYPLFLKPAADGSSVGISRVSAEAQLEPAWREARGTGRVVMAERLIDGPEYTCAVLDGEALPLIRVQPEGEFYDYDAKYLSDRTRYHCPAGLSPEREAQLQALCLQAFALMDGRHWGRVDFMLDAQGEPWLLEVNTLPGMTTHSLVPMAAAARGLEFDALCWRLLELTLERTDGS